MGTWCDRGGRRCVCVCVCVCECVCVCVCVCVWRAREARHGAAAFTRKYAAVRGDAVMRCCRACQAMRCCSGECLVGGRTRRTGPATARVCVGAWAYCHCHLLSVPRPLVKNSSTASKALS